MSQRAHADHFAPPPDSRDGRANLVGLSRQELGAALEELGEPAFRARQLWSWIYHHGASDFAAMTSLAKALRARLAERFRVERLEIARAQTSSGARPSVATTCCATSR